jgi:hypothetical protein
MPKWVGVRELHRRLRQYEPISYKRLLNYADAGVLPTLPRHGREHFRVPVGDKLTVFLLDRGFDNKEIQELLSEEDRKSPNFP